MTMAAQSGGGSRRHMSPGEAARSLHVSTKTVDRWADAGRIACVVTVGGHRRFRPEDIDALVEEMADRGARRRRSPEAPGSSGHQADLPAR